jgi:uncharacterized protein YndB with AHSA1/START domain
MHAMPARAHIPVVASHRFESPPERVFDAWLDRDTVRHSRFATPTGEMVPAEYLEVTRPSRLIFTFSTGEPEADRVTLEIVPDGEGSDLTLTHQLSARWAEHADRTRDEWVGILQGLADALGELPGKPW